MRVSKGRILTLVILSFCLVMALAGVAWAAEFDLKSTPENVHWGYYWADQPPVLTINSGDVVNIDTLSHEGILPDEAPPVPFFAQYGIPADEVLPDLIDVCEQVQQGAGNHVLTGPIYVNGAQPGDVLQIDILDIKPRVPYGVNAIRPNKGSLPEIFSQTVFKFIPLDLERNVAIFEEGNGDKQRIEIPLHPHMGSMGVAPPTSWGKANSIPPKAFGGNIDLNLLNAGATLYLPVFCEGALFSTGDGHAAMGDGEVSLTGIETSLTGRFEFTVRKDMDLTWPMAETPDYYVVFGFNTDLNIAMKEAVKHAVNFLVAEKNLTPEEAYSLASCAVDFEVTQVVDKNKGVHGLIPKSIFE